VSAIPVSRVNAFLLRKQHLLPSERGLGLESIVRGICALHSTAPLTPYLSLIARMPSFHAEDLDTALYEERSLVRLTCMRSTLHIVPAPSMATFFQATWKAQRRTETELGRMLVESALCAEGEQTAMLQRLHTRVIDSLATYGPSTVAELRERIPELGARFHYAPGKPYAGTFSIGSQIVPWLCTQGLAVRARPRGSRRSNLYEYASLADWLPGTDLHAIDTLQARMQLVRCYLAAFGPASLDDIAWWSGLAKRDVRRALDALGNEIVKVTIELLDEGFWMLSAESDALRDTADATNGAVCLLPSLDPYVMGYRDRRRFLAPEHQSQVFDRAGNAFATVWIDGQIAGVWRQVEDGVQILLWEPAPLPGLERQGKRVGRFLIASQGTDKPRPDDVRVLVEA
jgi:uncharacterized protein YcaQ